MRVLDLGCGSGRDLASWGVSTTDAVTGLDLDRRRLGMAQAQFRNRIYLQGRGESLPFRNESFDRVIAGVSLPYMKIPQALAELYRILAPGGGVSLSLHLLSFTVAELLHHAFPKPLPTFYRLYVLCNGCLFHSTGTNVGFFRGRTESFQTERGMKIALGRAGFVQVSFRRAGETFVADAIKRPSSIAMPAV
jgi:ubiquinone/menaquinone biosynthesis C-methylase UbiE